MPQTTLLRDNLTRFPLQFDFNYFNWLYQNLVLPFNMEAQTQSNWCWAATSKSVSHFYSGLSPWTQCKIAGSELSQSCCTTPVPSACNVPWYLDRALQRTENFVSIQSGIISWQEVKDQLDRGLVVGARIGWNGGGGHFMVIYGVSRVLLNEYLYIDDPIYGKAVLSYDEFATNYQGCGTWTHTYFTKKRHYFMWLKDLQFNPELLKPIPEVRPLARFNTPNFNISQQIPEPEFSTAHHTYIITLNDIQSEMNLPERPVSLRIMEMEEAAPLAVYEVGLDEANPRFLQLHNNKNYIRMFENAVNTLKLDANLEIAAELRHIRIPALNIEAVWLHYDDQQQDRIVLLRQFEDGSMDGYKRIFNAREFTEYLNRQKVRQGQMDELMGAGGGGEGA